MKPIKFKGQNYTLNSKLGSMPMFKNHKGMVLTCWKLNLIERIRIFFTGKLYNLQQTENKPVQAIVFSTRKSDFFSPKVKDVEEKTKLKKVA